MDAGGSSFRLVTPEGEAVLQYADEIVRLGNELRATVAGGLPGRPMKLTVGVSATIPNLVAFHMLEPAFELTDPVQVQVRESIGLNFAAALRSFLRQDPNIILVGEIRDFETAEIAVKAALTGHLVLSTLHTNDAPSTVTRLIDMGLEPFNVAAALNCITAQRLLRRICKNCKEPHVYPDDVMEAAKFPIEWAKNVTFYKGKGCDQCNGTGYKGRAGLYEVMAMTPDLRKVIMAEGSVDQIREQALKDGMLTLRMDGMVKIEKGVTTLEEVVKETAA